MNNVKETRENSLLVFNDEDSCFNFISYFDQLRGGTVHYYKFRQKQHRRSRNKNRKHKNRKHKNTRKTKK